MSASLNNFRNAKEKIVTIYFPRKNLKGKERCI